MAVKYTGWHDRSRRDAREGLVDRWAAFLFTPARAGRRLRSDDVIKDCKQNVIKFEYMQYRRIKIIKGLEVNQSRGHSNL